MTLQILVMCAPSCAPFVDLCRSIPSCGKRAPSLSHRVSDSLHFSPSPRPRCSPAVRCRRSTHPSVYPRPSPAPAALAERAQASVSSGPSTARATLDAAALAASSPMAPQLTRAVTFQHMLRVSADQMDHELQQKVADDPDDARRIRHCWADKHAAAIARMVAVVAVEDASPTSS
jgi:hypothetical protein